MREDSEPTLESMDDYNGDESSEKRFIIWIVILSGLLIGAIYEVVGSNATVSDELKEQKERSGIFR